MAQEHLYNYVLEVADNCLILGQRLGELCGHGPTLETDIACTNISLDLIGQTRSYFQYASSLSGGEKSEDDIAFLRLEKHYRNVLLVEQPNTTFGHVIARQFMFDVYHHAFLTKLSASSDPSLKAIALKAIKEVSYHKRFSGDWVKRLGDGTPESNAKMQEGIDHMWPYVAELFDMSDAAKALLEQGISVDVEGLRVAYLQELEEVLTAGQLKLPDNPYPKKGGKDGRHSEHMGYLLADLQYMQRTYPNMSW